MYKKNFFLTTFLLYVFTVPTAQATTVLLWKPDKQNAYGHATLQTNTYHMSLWPNGDVKQDLGVLKTLSSGVQGCLVLHHDYDRYLEGNRDPDQYVLENISDSKLNQAYEEMLSYNNITPDRATLDAVEEITRKWLSNGKKPPEISLSKSRYSFGGEVREDFYKYPQSCTTFSISLLQIGGGPNYLPPLPLIPSAAIHKAVVEPFVPVVPEFESYVKKIAGNGEQKECSIF